MDAKERLLIEAERREQILSYPLFTLMRLGWEVKPGTVQGGIFYHEIILRTTRCHTPFVGTNKGESNATYSSGLGRGCTRKAHV